MICQKIFRSANYVDYLWSPLNHDTFGKLFGQNGSDIKALPPSLSNLMAVGTSSLEKSSFFLIGTAFTPPLPNVIVNLLNFDKHKKCT